MQEPLVVDQAHVAGTEAAEAPLLDQDLDDFAASSLKAARYPQYNNALYMIPMDLMSLQPEINLDHVAEAGLPLPNPPKGGPQSGAELIEWGAAMTKRRRGKVTRSGILMTGSGVQPTVTWGIVAHQMGFRRASNDLRTAAVNPRAGIEAMEWVLGLFDEHRVATRDLTDRYKAFGAGQGSIFWVPRGTVHAFRNAASSPAVAYVVYFPPFDAKDRIVEEGD